MIVRELIEKLKELPEDVDVIFVDDNGLGSELCNPTLERFSHNPQKQYVEIASR